MDGAVVGGVLPTFLRSGDSGKEVPSPHCLSSGVSEGSTWIPERDTGRGTDRQVDRETDRQVDRDRQTGVQRQRDRWTETDRQVDRDRETDRVGQAEGDSAMRMEQ